MEIIYILGAGRSGSTILAHSINKSIDSIHIGEISYLHNRGFYDNSVCSCGNSFHDCTFWGQVINGIDIKSPAIKNFYKNRLRLRHFFKIDNTYNEYLRHLYKNIFTATKKQYIIDSSKSPIYLMHLIKAFPDIPIKVIYLHRDSRGYAYSRLSGLGKSQIEKTNIFMSSLDYLLINLVSFLAIRKAKNFMILKYEDFATNKNIMNEIIKRFDLKIENETDPLHHCFSGNPIMFGEGNINKIKINQKWKSKLSSFQKFIIFLITLPAYIGQKFIARDGHE